MSKRRNKALQRAQMTTQGNLISQAAIQAALMQMSAKQMSAKGQNNQYSALFSPGQPLPTQPGVDPRGVPRQFSFPIAYNTSNVDRTLGKADVPTFAQLRTLAKSYSGITLSERVWMDMVPQLDLKIQLRPELKAQGMDEKDFQKEIKFYRTFFEKPDKQHDLHSWIRMDLRGQTQIDELYLYKHRTRNGQLYALEVVDGASMKPLLDDWGRIPQPPLPAFQQFPWGIPGQLFSTRDMIHYQESPAEDTPFGFSRVERIIMEVNQALRKKKRDLAMFTEGNIPQGIMQVPEASNWTPDQIDAYEQLWNSLIAGNVQQQVRVKFTQPGMTYVRTDSGEILTDFDLFLYNICTGVYGISLADIGITGDIHKSADAGQQNMMFRRTLGPLVVVYASILTSVIRDDFHDDRFIATFSGFEEVEDVNEQANMYKTLASFGAIAPSDVAAAMKLPDVPKTGPFIMTTTGPIFLKDYEEGSDMRSAQQQAQMAGLQLAAQSPGSDANQQDEGENDAEDTQDSAKTTDKQSPSTDQKADANSVQSATKNTNKGNTGSEQTSSNQKNHQATERSVQVVSDEIESNGSNEEQRTNDKHWRAVGNDRPEMLQEHTGMMLAFMLDPDTAAQLALPGGEPVDDMHCTLAFLGDMNNPAPTGKLNPAETPDVIKTVLSAFASNETPIQGNVGGLARFTSSPSSDGQSPVIALVNAPGLQDWRRRLVNVLESARYQVANDFDYSPHITLAYIPDGDPMPVDEVPALPLNFNTLCLAIGDDRTFFPIGQPILPDNKDLQRADFRRWRDVALKDIKAGKHVRHFESDVIPEDIYTRLSSALERCTTGDEVRAAFKAAQEGDESFFVEAVLSGGHQQRSKLLWKDALLHS